MALEHGSGAICQRHEGKLEDALSKAGGHNDRGRMESGKERKAATHKFA